MDMKTKRFANAVLKADVGEGDFTPRFRLTERSVDRIGEVMMPQGAVLENFKANSPVLFGHGWSSSQGRVPIGKVLMDTMEITKDVMDANIKFDDDGTDPFATMISAKVAKGYLKSGSIGFNALEISREPQFPKQKGATFTKWELLEYSIDAIPMLPTSLAQKSYMELSQAIEDNFGKEERILYEKSINKYFGFDDKEVEDVIENQFDYKALANDVKEIKGQVLQLQTIIEGQSKNNDTGIITIDDATANEMLDLFKSLKDFSDTVTKQ